MTGASAWPRPNPDCPIPSDFFDIYPFLVCSHIHTSDSIVSTRSEDAEIEEETYSTRMMLSILKFQAWGKDVENRS